MQYGPEVSKKTLMDRIVLFRRQNNLPEIEFLDIVLENYWCNLPENFGRCDNAKLPLGIMATLRGGVAVLKNYMYKTFVSQEKAEARAKKCAGCPYNDMSPSRTWLDMIALNSVADRRTAQYDRLGNCSVCNCVLNMKVFYDGKIAKPTEEQQKRYDEVNCWQKDIIE